VLSHYAHTRSIILLDGEAASEDDYGNDVATWTPTTVAGCAWWPSSTTEAEPVGATTASSRYSLLMPETTLHASGRAPSSIDRVLLPGESGQWQIDGEPRAHWSPITRAQGGLQCWLVRVTG
jgi:hypothetical protein